MAKKIKLDAIRRMQMLERENMKLKAENDELKSELVYNIMMGNLEDPAEEEEAK